MNILYIDPIVHSETSKTYQYYNGLFDALNSECKCYLSKNADIESCPFQPDVIIFGIGWNSFEKIEWLEKIDIPKIFFVFKPQNKFGQKMNFCVDNKVDLILSSIPEYKRYEEITGIRAERFCYAADNKVFHTGSTKEYDVGFSGALHDNKNYCAGAFKTKNIRSRLQDKLKAKEKKGVKTFLNGSDSINPRIRNYDKYADIMRKSKMWIATNSAFGDITPRYFEVLMSGTLLLCNEIPNTYKDILRNGETCVEFKNDLSDFNDKFYHYLNNWGESELIISNAIKESYMYTWDFRANELIKIIEEIKCQ